MSRNTKMEERWLRYNVRGDGLRSSTRTAKHSYAGPIFYANGWPIARLAMLPGGNWACLNKHYVHPVNPVEWTKDGGPVLALNMSVPDIAAFSSYDGDWLDDVHMHERLRNLWLLIASAQIERAKEAAFTTLCHPGNPNVSGTQGVLRNALDHAIKEYTTYAAAFQLRWHSFPTIYKAELETVIRDRKRFYFSDVEVKKRERIAARAGAKKAFGLDNKE